MRTGDLVVLTRVPEGFPFLRSGIVVRGDGHRRGGLVRHGGGPVFGWDDREVEIVGRAGWLRLVWLWLVVAYVRVLRGGRW